MYTLSGEKFILYVNKFTGIIKRRMQDRQNVKNLHYCNNDDEK